MTLDCVLDVAHTAPLASAMPYAIFLCLVITATSGMRSIHFFRLTPYAFLKLPAWLPMMAACTTFGAIAMLLPFRSAFRSRQAMSFSFDSPPDSVELHFRSATRNIAGLLSSARI